MTIITCRSCVPMNYTYETNVYALYERDNLKRVEALLLSALRLERVNFSAESGRTTLLGNSFPYNPVSTLIEKPDCIFLTVTAGTKMF